MEKLLTIILAVVVVLPLVILMTVPVAIWKGFVLSKLWLWFIVPTFGLPALSVPLAIGLCVLVGLFTANLARRQKDEETSFWTLYLVDGFVAPALALLFGYIVTLFV